MVTILTGHHGRSWCDGTTTLPHGQRGTGSPIVIAVRVGHEAADAAEAVALFREHLQQHPALVELASRELRGFDLGCTCPLDQPCHADVWLELVNE